MATDYVYAFIQAHDEDHHHVSIVFKDGQWTVQHVDESKGEEDFHKPFVPIADPPAEVTNWINEILTRY